MYARRSVRAYRSDPIPEETLQEVVKAGLYAPSAMNQQSWHFVVLTGKGAERYRKFAAEQLGRDAYYPSPAIILVFADSRAIEPVRDGSLALGNMMNAAEALGLGSCWVNAVNPIFGGSQGMNLAEKWGIPEGYQPVGSLVLGYGNEAPKEAAPRRPETVTWVRE